ncbi:unnamed protein product, partial [Brenthis ino]
MALAVRGITRRVLLFTVWVLYVDASKWPAHTDVPDNASYDYVVVGAGTAGCIVANRLSQQKDVEVLAIEAGGDPPEEKDILSLFVTEVHPHVYWNYETEDDGYTAQYHKDKHLNLRSGKMLGGSSGINYLYYSRGAPRDYEAWVNATGDESWSWQNVLPYFKKSEHLKDEEILNSKLGRFHGNNGEMIVTRDLRNITLKYLEAFQELGHKVVDDINGEQAIGFAQPMFWLSNGLRHTTAEGFLLPIKNRPNFHVMKNTLVTKILFDENKNAVGVQTKNVDGSTVNIYARKEIIISAGAFNTPKLLMLSGVGPQAHLESFDIPVISNLPVGEYLRDHMATVLVMKGKTTDETFERGIAHFPIPTFVGLGAIDKSQDYPDYQSHNLIFKNHPAGLTVLCSSVFHLNPSICEELFSAGVGREVLFSVFGASHLLSHGSVQLRSTNPEDPLKINTGFLSNPSDLDHYAKCIQDFAAVINSSYFKEVEGEILHFNIPSCKHLEKDTLEYWKCYTLNMMDSYFLSSCTCPMGPVLDSRLRVRGVKKLRVADASAMPELITSSIGSAVMMIAEKAADFIIEDI